MTTAAEKIDAVLAGKKMSFADLARAIYPDERSHRYQHNGGPPGCYMTLSRTLRRGGFRVEVRGAGPGNRIVHPRKKS